MSDTIIHRGYLETDYAEGPYAGGEVDHHISMQVNQVIRSEKISGMQAQQVITLQPENGMQAHQTVNKNVSYGMQSLQVITTQNEYGMQANQHIAASEAIGMQALHDTLRHATLDVYLVDDYLTGPYLVAQMAAYCGMQVNQVITSQSEYGMQANQIVTTQDEIGMQANQVITSQSEYGMQASQILQETTHLNGMQANQVVTTQDEVGMQANQVITTQNEYGMQAKMIVNVNENIGMQASQFISDRLKATGMQARHDTLRHATLDVYLVDDYLTGPYLVSQMGGFCGMQVRQVVRVENEYGMQANQVITTQNEYGMQTLQIVTLEKHYGMQAQQLAADRLGMQATMVIYNITQLRVMYDFPSRGAQSLLGLNWSSTSTAAGDFSPNNVNTDIIEQVFRSQDGSASTVTLTCDTGIPQGVPVDTIAILGHNISRSGQVQVQGSNDNFASAPNVTFNMIVEEDNMYYIAPEFPTSAGQNRYWRFIIQDPTNADTYIEVGSIVFGVSHIFTTAENFQNPVVRGFRHFKDSIQTEGFTNVSNDRALKKFVRLSFDKLNYFRGNYRILEEMMLEARTSLKVLVIPTPQYPSRFAVFAKLVSLPEITHTSIDSNTEYIDLSLEFDESL